MVIALLLSTYISCVFIGIGYVFYNFINYIFTEKNQNETFFEHFSIYGLCGYIFYYLVGIYSNFIIPINPYFAFLLSLCGLITFAFLFKKIFTQTTKQEFIVYFVSLLGFVLCFLNSILSEDSRGYHVQIIEWITNERAFLGGINLNERFGFSEAMHYAAPLLNFPLRGFEKNGWLIPSMVISCFYICFLFKKILTNNNDFYKIIIILTTLIFIIISKFYYTTWFFAPYSDFVTSYYTIIPILYILAKITQQKLYNTSTHTLFFIFCVFAVSLKLSQAPNIFLILFLFFIDKNKYEFIKKLMICGIFIFGPLVIRNFMTTGCLLYPLEKTCFNTSWSNYTTQHGMTLKQSLESVLYLTQHNIAQLKIYLSAYSNIISIFMMIISMIFSVMVLKLKILSKLFNLSVKDSVFFILSMNVCIVFWFLFLSITRFGLAYIFLTFYITLASLVYFVFKNKINNLSLNFKIPFFSILGLLFIIMNIYGQGKIFSYPVFIPEIIKITPYVSRVNNYGVQYHVPSDTTELYTKNFDCNDITPPCFSYTTHIDKLKIDDSGFFKKYYIDH